MGYLRPCNAPISSSWQDHKNRNPPSSEPGTDYACAYGTPILAAEAGLISDAKTTNGAATGRYVTISLDSGSTVRYLHLSSLIVSRGQRVSRGQQIAWSGASANGSDWGVGAHVHTTLWPGAIWAAPTVDFERYTEEDDMPLTEADVNAIVAAVFNDYVTKAPNGADVSLAQFMTQTWTLGNMVYDETPERTAKLVEADDDDCPPTSTRLERPAWLVGAALLLIGIVDVVALVLEHATPS